MNTAIESFYVNKHRVIEWALAGGISIIGGFAITIFTKISYSYMILTLVALLMVIAIAFLKKIKRFLMALLIVTIPVNIDRSLFLIDNHTGGVPGLVVSAWGLVLLCLYLIWIMENVTGNRQKLSYFPSLTIASGLFLVFCIVSTARSVEIKASVFQILQIIQVILLFFYIANNIQTEKDYKFIISVLFSTLFLEVLLGFYQHFVNEYIDLGILSDSKPHRARKLGSETILSVSGTMTGNHPYADFLIMILSLVLAAIVNKGKVFTRIIYLTLFVAGLTLLIFSLSRGAWLGFALGLCCFFSLKLWYATNKLKVLVSIVVLTITVLAIVFPFQNLLLQRIYGEDFGSASSRIPMIKIAFAMIKSNPIIGVGINTYAEVMTHYDQTGLTYGYHYPVHNVLLQLTAEIGIPGAIAFLWFLINLYRYAFKNLPKANDFVQNNVIGLITGITALIIHALSNNGTIATNPYILFWVFAGLILAIKKQEIK